MENQTLQNIVKFIEDTYILEAIAGAVGGGLCEYLKLRKFSRIRVFAISTSIMSVVFIFGMLFRFLFIKREWPSSVSIILFFILVIGISFINVLYSGVSKNKSQPPNTNQ